MQTVELSPDPTDAANLSDEDSEETAPLVEAAPLSSPTLISPLSRAIDLTSMIVPLAALVWIAYAQWGRSLDAVQICVMFAMYLFTGYGITIGYHRLFTHKGFQCGPGVRVTLAVLGSLAVQGPILWWAAIHRKHHQCSDAPGDPHSPHLHGDSITQRIAGAYHSHFGWLFLPDPPDADRFVVDLAKEKSLVFLNKTYPLWVALSLLIPAALAGAIERSWMAFAWGALWGGLIRICFVHHITWSINSACHLWGSRKYKSHDLSRNNTLFGILGLGEGWHNNHHAFPSSARHGLEWHQFDSSWIIINALRALGLVWNVKLPSEAIKSRKLLTAN